MSPKRLRQSIQGFTLFEVCICLAIITFGVISVIMLIPQGLRAQQNSRMKIYASVIMQQISNAMIAPKGSHGQAMIESFRISNNLFMRRGSQGVEALIQSRLADIGLLPLPPDLMRRIDSDNDEIANIVQGGGQVYFMEAGTCPQQLIMGVIGYEQQNALPNHPSLAWPMWEHHPMLPATWEKESWEVNNWPGLVEFKALYDAFNSDGNIQSTGNKKSYAFWQNYLRKANELVAVLGIDSTIYTPVDATIFSTETPPIVRLIPTLPKAFPANGAPWTEGDPDYFPKPYVVFAISHLAHAAAMCTFTGTDYGKNELGLSGLPTGRPADDDMAYAKKTYEACVAWIMRAAPADPNNWGLAREVAHQTAWDHPLLQYDLFPTSAFPVYVDPGHNLIQDGNPLTKGDQSYRIIGIRPIIDYGQAYGVRAHTSFTARPNIPPNHDHIAATWGNPNHSYLTRTFDASERMRQIVFWAVDWQSFEDFESAPSAELDAAFGFRDSAGLHVAADWYGNPQPERGLYWIDQSRTKRAGDTRQANSNNQTFSDSSRENGGLGFVVDDKRYKAGYYMGMYGADRNGNGIFDKGNMPKSVRLRAMTIARFNYYDGILPAKAMD